MITFNYETPARFPRTNHTFPQAELEAKEFFTSDNCYDQKEFNLKIKIKKLDWFPCFNCGGTGRDGYNGEWLICIKCQGKGNTTKEIFYKNWQEEKFKYQKALSLFNYKLDTLKFTFNKLSREEIELLDEYYDPGGCCGCPSDHWEWIKNI